MACYRDFILPKGRSPGFASARADCHSSCSGSLSLRLGASVRPWPRRRGQLVGSLCKRHAVTGSPGSDRLWAHDFRVCFTPLFEVLFTFPSRYWFAVGLSVVFSLAGWSPPILAGFLVSRDTQVPSCLLAPVSLTGLSPSTARLSRRFCYRRASARRRSFNPRGRLDGAGLGSCAFARHYLRNHCCFLFLRVLRCFSSPGWPPAWPDGGTSPAGLPHSDIRGSTGMCPSPRLFAACRVLRRLREPRHPSCALFPFLLSFGKRAFAFFSALALRQGSIAMSCLWSLGRAQARPARFLL